MSTRMSFKFLKWLSPVLLSWSACALTGASFPQERLVSLRASCGGAWCCPSGETSSASTAPDGLVCPEQWIWSSDAHRCCLSQQQVAPSNNGPICPEGYIWSDNSGACTRNEPSLFRRGGDGGGQGDSGGGGGSHNSGSGGQGSYSHNSNWSNGNSENKGNSKGGETSSGSHEYKGGQNSGGSYEWKGGKNGKTATTNYSSSKEVHAASKTSSYKATSHVKATKSSKAEHKTTVQSTTTAYSSHVYTKPKETEHPKASKVSTTHQTGKTTKVKTTPTSTYHYATTTTKTETKTTPKSTYHHTAKTNLKSTYQHTTTKTKATPTTKTKTSPSSTYYHTTTYTKPSKTLPVSSTYKPTHTKSTKTTTSSYNHKTTAHTESSKTHSSHYSSPVHSTSYKTPAPSETTKTVWSSSIYTPTTVTTPSTSCTESSQTSYSASVPAPTSCKGNEFWFEEKKCCLPSGGSNSSLPSPAIACPQAWEFSHDYSCCVPKTAFAPLPICPAKYSWDSVNYVCQPSSSSSSGPKPSSIYGRKSKTSRRAEQLPFAPCPLGLQKCPISELLGSTADDYECVETTNDLVNCGGCSSTEEGRDCTAIPNAINVACEHGTCIVSSCSKGYVPAEDDSSCVRAGNRKRFIREFP